MKYQIIDERSIKEAIERIVVDDMTGSYNFIFYITSGCREVYFLIQQHDTGEWGFVFAGTPLTALDARKTVGLGYQADTKKASIYRLLASNQKLYTTTTFNEACEIIVNEE